VKHWPILIIFGVQIKKKRDINNYSLAHLTLILLLHYRVKCCCRSRSFGVYNNEFILGTSCRLRKIIDRKIIWKFYLF